MRSAVSSPRFKRGFTLIELLVVIAIIGILSSVVLASLNTARLKARDARRIADVKQIQLALALMYDACGVYPPKLTSSVNCSGSSVSLAPTYISILPVDPSSNQSYSYNGLGNGTVCSSYHLGALLEDKTNSALLSDVDAAVGQTCTGASLSDFSGTSPGSSNACTSTGGTPEPNGTEQCYDVTP